MGAAQVLMGEGLLRESTPAAWNLPTVTQVDRECVPGPR